MYSTVVGRRRYLSYLSVQGGLEIPCSLTFTGTSKEINELKSHCKSYCTLQGCSKKQLLVATCHMFIHRPRG